MSRSAIDATRFTATAPHAYTRSSPARASNSSTTPTPSSPSQPQPSRPESQSTQLPPKYSQQLETPPQKVARLRAEHAAKKMAQFSRWDRVVVSGRQYADIAHRVVTYSLVGFTFVAGVFCAFSTGDMIMHNRRKRREWYAEQQAGHEQKLRDAKDAAARGTANDDQLLLLNRERAAEEAAESERNKMTIWRSIKSVFSTEALKKEEGFGQGRGNTPALVEGSSSLNSDSMPRAEEQSIRESPVLQAIEKKRRDGEREILDRGAAPGPLDRMAENAASTAGSTWRSWISSK